jgi:uncharacterized protein YprB with RNaseH-like and TPR domain
MSKLRNKLNYLEKDKIRKKWQDIDSSSELSTREKLEKLVNLSLKREKSRERVEVSPGAAAPAVIDNGDEVKAGNGAVIRDFSYPLDSVFGKFALEEWKTVSARQLTVLFGEDEFDDLSFSPMDLLFFDTETTGLSGGTGTIPFMLGFGFFDAGVFRVKIFVLNDLYNEGEFLDRVDEFLGSREFAATVTYNGKSFDFPLMEARYILQRKRFPLLGLPHLDFLFPARTLWKNTYESRKLAFLGDILLGISRDDDVDPAYIPTLYFNYLRSKSFAVLQDVVEHNALDLVGLAALVLLALKYQEDIVHTGDEGEILGVARLFEKNGDFDSARGLYEILTRGAVRQDIIKQAVKGLAILKKKKKLYSEASELWQTLADSCDQRVIRELSVHFEHREKNYERALDYVQRALTTVELTEAQRRDFEKRLDRLNRKMKTLDNN